MALMGLIEESYRLPLVPLQAKNREKMAQILRDLKLIQ
jgi:dihydrodipicolinate synthase/N-acetylneuraminate lyase